MQRSVAIVGASIDRHKFGNKSVRAHARAGWSVFPVNPREAEIEGLPCYATVAEVPNGVDRISMYVPPGVGLSMLGDIVERRPGEVFLNPGSESPELLAAAQQAGLKIATACSIVDVGFSPAEFPDT